MKSIFYQLRKFLSVSWCAKRDLKFFHCGKEKMSIMLGLVSGLLLIVTVSVRGQPVCRNKTDAVDFLMESQYFPTLQDLQAKCSEAVAEMECQKNNMGVDRFFGFNPNEATIKYVNEMYHYIKEICSEGSDMRQVYLEAVDCYNVVLVDEVLNKHVNETEELVNDFEKTQSALELQKEENFHNIAFCYKDKYWAKSFFDAVGQNCPEASSKVRDDLMTHVHEPFWEMMCPEDKLMLWTVKFMEFQASRSAGRNELSN